MYIRIFSIAVLIGLSPGNIDAVPTHNSRVQQELTPLPVHGVRGSSTATDVVRELEIGRRTSCLNNLIRNQTLQKKNLIQRKFKNKLKACKKLPKKKQKACRRKSAAWKKKQLRNIKIDYAVVRDRCGGACFESSELNVAFELYTRSSEGDQKQMEALHGKISDWPTCSTTHLDDLFFPYDNFDDGCRCDDSYGTVFNGDLSSWDISSVTSMKGTFQSSRKFNGDISAWDTSSVTSMDETFAFTAGFNRDLSTWDISNVSSARLMFYEAMAFKQCLEWFFQPGTDTHGMFSHDGRISENCEFDSSELKVAFDLYTRGGKADREWIEALHGKISDWSTSLVTHLDDLFEVEHDDQNDDLYDGSSFNGNLSSWDISSVTSMDGTFQASRKFNGNISTWDASSITSMKYTFAYTTDFNINLSLWDISNVSSALKMFYKGRTFTQCLEWSFKLGTNTDQMFKGNSGRTSDKC